MNSPNCGPLMMDRRWKTNIETAPNCPRCASTNTKFCYYNNYSLSQPRYFCKGCRRYWTKGGSLRNVPFGGGCRKNRRGRSLRSRSDHLASSYSSSQPDANSGSSDGSLDEKSGSDIDLADVFSKFLNPDHSGSEIANYPTASQLDEMIAAEDSVLDMDFNGISLQEPPEFIDPDMDMGIDALLSDGISQDILWTDIPPVPNFSWQPLSTSPPQLQQVEEVQGYEGVVMDDHSMFHNNFFSGNWNSLDIPSYGA